jgi:RecB family endonuclease NucS
METHQRQLILNTPTLSEAFAAIKTGISHKRTIIVAGECMVDYEGRANSHLSAGERFVVFKSDGSALVHRPRDYAPVNWQPPRSLFQTKLVKDSLVVRVYRRKDHEVMEITFTRVIMVSILDLKDVGEFTLYATESDMQQAILMQPSLLEEGFRPITHEHPVDPGFIDILGVDKDNVLTVVELKRVKATKKAVLQLKKYMNVINFDVNRRVRAILVAPSLAQGTLELLASLGYEFKALTPQQCTEVIKRRSDKAITDFFK